MKKLILALIFGSFTSVGFAAQDWQPVKNGLAAEYLIHKGKFDKGVNVDLKGFGLVFSTSPYQNGWWGKLEYFTSSEYSDNEISYMWSSSGWITSTKRYDIDYFEASFGGNQAFYSANNAYIVGSIGMGVGVGSVENLDSTPYITLPIGLEAGYGFTPNLSLYGGIGYKWAWDISTDGETLCRDGTYSNSTGSGTCSWHGGIAPNQQKNTIGSFDGVTYKVGLRYHF